MRSLLLAGATAAAALAASASPSAASDSTWAAKANQVCTVWIAKAKKEFGTPVSSAQLYTFAQKAKSLESQELADLEKIPGRPNAGTAALAAVKVDISEISAAISAWNSGNAALFVTKLKRYLNDGRPKSAFAIAGAAKCG